VGARFSALVRTGLRLRPDVYVMGTEPFLGVKRSGRVVDHPPSSIADVKERVELYIYSFSWSFLG